MTIAACTVVTRNHLAYARLVARSWTDHHPSSHFTILVVDHDPSAPPTWAHRDVSVVGPADVGVDAERIRTMAAIYSASELACALKPAVLRHVLQHVDVAVYLDGDIEVLDAMDDLEDLGRARGVVLSPHNLEPLPDDGLLPDRFTMLLAGMFNGGLVAVGRSGRAFLDWWEAQLERDGHHEPSEGLHGDQRWLDFVPTYFEHHVLRDPTYNVAYWNLHERPCTWDGDAVAVDGRRVRCFHYSGLTEDHPWLLSGFMGHRPRVQLRDHPAVARLVRRYLDRARGAGLEDDRAIGYRYAATADGTPVDRRARRLWRDQLLAAESDPTGTTEVAPSPWDADGGAAWVTWLRSPAEGDTVGRYLQRVWSESADLQRSHPDLSDPLDHGRFLQWVLEAGVDAAEIPPTLLPDHEDFDMDDLIGPDGRPRRRAPLPDVRSQQPVDALEQARRALSESPSTGTRGRAARRAVDRALKGRDERNDAVAASLADAVAELAERIAELGERVNRVNDELPEQAERIDTLDGAVEDLGEGVEHLHDRIDGLTRDVDGEKARIDGALEQDAITAGIVADAETRLGAEIADLQLRIDKLDDDPDPEDPAGHDPDGDDEPDR